jgi:hypothetical protein
VREACTVRGSYFVDAAFIIGQVQELAGFRFIQPVALATPLPLQPFVLKLGDRHFKMRGDPDKVLLVERGRHGLAAIGTGQAVGLDPYFFFNNSDGFIESTGRIVLEAGEKTPEYPFLF